MAECQLFERQFFGNRRPQPRSFLENKIHSLRNQQFVEQCHIHRVMHVSEPLLGTLDDMKRRQNRDTWIHLRTPGLRQGSLACEKDVKPLLASLPRMTISQAANCKSRDDQNKNGPPRSLATGRFENYPGSDLRSHTVTRAVSSAQRGLTSVFGMGTGVTPAIWPPGKSISKSYERRGLRVFRKDKTLNSRAFKLCN